MYSGWIPCFIVFRFYSPAREASPKPGGESFPPPGPSAQAAAEAGRLGLLGAHHLHPLVERERALDQVRERGRPPAPAARPARCASASSRTVSSASTAWPTRSGISAAGTPSPSSSPARAVARAGRERRGHEVAGAGAAHERARLAAAPQRQGEHLEEDVRRRHAGRVEALRLGGAHRHGGGVLRHARQLHPHRVVGDLADHAARAGRRPPRCAPAPRSATRRRARPPPPPSRARARDRPRRPPAAAERLLERHRRRRAVRRHEPLGERHDPRAARTRPAR